MNKLLIVDDEEFVRTSIINIIDWSSLGFTEVFRITSYNVCYTKLLRGIRISVKTKSGLTLIDSSSASTPFSA